jgi:hypothetical protein
MVRKKGLGLSINNNQSMVNIRISMVEFKSQKLCRIAIEATCMLYY